MVKAAPVFECTACGLRSSKWLGRCPTCAGWNSFEQVPDAVRALPSRPGAQPVALSHADLAEWPRLSTCIPGLDRVLGGGLVRSSLVLLAGEPGVGKSTLLLQVAALVAPAGRVVYVTAEESARQVALRARRLGCVHDHVLLLAESSVDAAVAAAAACNACLVIVDSVQAMAADRVPAVAGSVSQVREVAAQLMELAKRDGPPVVLVGHVTKEGVVAGPKSLEHLVDVVLEFAGAASHLHRTLRATKNRFGPAMELALFAMGDNGLAEVPNASAVLLADRRADAPGSAIAVVMEGTTPLLVEVQALVSRSPLAVPRRVAQGVESSRLALLLAVLEKRAGIRLAERDVFVNVVGGIAVEEPALDLAVAAAVISSAADRPLPGDLALFGEVGLLGEVRAVSRPAERLREAAALGFLRCALPSSAAALASPLALLPLDDVTDIVSLLTVVKS